jgi:hypothetical protein
MEQPLLNEKAYYYLADVKRWARLISIFGYIMIGIIVFFAFFFGFFYDNAAIQRTPGAPSGMVLLLVYIIMAVIYFFPVHYLGQFASNLGRSLKNGDDVMLTRSLSNLRGFFRYIGILAIILIALFVLSIMVGFFAAIFGVIMA